MKELLLAAVLLFTTLDAAQSEKLDPNIASMTAFVKIGETVETTTLPRPTFRPVICNFSATFKESNPPSYILSGKVVSDNTGSSFGQDFIPVFFGSTPHHPRLAALTNADGEFRFRVWLENNPGTTRLQATQLKDSTLYLDGKFNGNSEMLTCRTYVHPLGAFLERSTSQKPKTNEK